MSNDSIKEKVVRGTFWVVLERLSIQIVSFLVTLVLARLLTPNDYGTVALLTIFIAVASVLADSGLGQALVQKKEATELDFNSVFFVGITLAGVLYLFLFITAPLIGRFYDNAQLPDILRVLSILLIFNSINSVQNASLNRQMLFHLSFRISLLQAIVSGGVGVTCAYLRFGPWALVWSQVAGGFVGVVLRWFIIAWRPRLIISFDAVKELFRFGWKMTFASLIDNVYNNLYGLLIGKVYTRADLAFVNKGRHLPELLMGTINGAIARVSFPAMSQIQDNTDKIRRGMQKVLKCSTFLVFPLMTILALTAKNVVFVLLGRQWLPAVPYVQLACFSFALWPLHTINLQTMAAMGRSDIFLKLEILKKVVGVIAIVISIQYGVFPLMVVLACFVDPMSLLLNSWPNQKLLCYGFSRQLRDVARSIIGCVVITAILVWEMVVSGTSVISKVLLVALQAVSGLSLYLLTTWCLRCEELWLLAASLKSLLYRSRVPDTEVVS